MTLNNSKGEYTRGGRSHRGTPPSQPPEYTYCSTNVGRLGDFESRLDGACIDRSSTRVHAVFWIPVSGVMQALDKYHITPPPDLFRQLEHRTVKGRTCVFGNDVTRLLNKGIGIDEQTASLVPLEVFTLTNETPSGVVA